MVIPRADKLLTNLATFTYVGHHGTSIKSNRHRAVLGNVGSNLLLVLTHL